MLDCLVKRKIAPRTPSSTKRDGQMAHGLVPILNGKPRKTNTFAPKAKHSSSSAETTQIPIAAPLAKAWPNIRSSNTHVRHAHPNPNAAPRRTAARSPAKNMRTPAMSPAPSANNPNTRSRQSCGIRARSSLPTSCPS
ncbi:unnamed protein product [Hapterophycus canaliculatus]